MLRCPEQLYEFLQLHGCVHVALDLKSTAGVRSERLQSALEQGPKVAVIHTQCHIWLPGQGSCSSCAATWRTHKHLIRAADRMF